ncbi:hypothetical protein ATKI12_6839 [Kitasatospora sp. Ki12]
MTLPGGARRTRAPPGRPGLPGHLDTQGTGGTEPGRPV